MDGLELSTDKLDLAAPDRCDPTLSDFHEISRAAAALKDRWVQLAGSRPSSQQVSVRLAYQRVFPIFPARIFCLKVLLHRRETSRLAGFSPHQ